MNISTWSFILHTTRFVSWTIICPCYMTRLLNCDHPQLKDQRWYFWLFLLSHSSQKRIQINNGYYCSRSGHIIISVGVEIYKSVDSNRRVILVIILSVIVFCVCLCHYHWHIEVKCRVAYCLSLQYSTKIFQGKCKHSFVQY